jgi:predicted O-methyltransferase YrrM
LYSDGYGYAANTREFIMENKPEREFKIKIPHFTRDLYNYILKISPEENFYLKELRLKTDALKYSRLRSPTEQVNFMMFLLQLIKPINILEIGTFTGYATLAMALATSSNTKIITCDITNIFPEIGQEVWKQAGVSSRIQLMLGPAKDTLEKLHQQKQTFDFIFIDADKENYWHYFENSLNMLTDNGIIMIDNVLWRGQVADENIVDPTTTAIRNFNQQLSQQFNINYCVLPIGDGVTLVSTKK